MTASILDLPIESAHGETVREFLAAVARESWEDSKRVFGTSDWRYDIYLALMRAGRVKGSLDEYGYVEEMDDVAADVLVMAAIDELSGAGS